MRRSGELRPTLAGLLLGLAFGGVAAAQNVPIVDVHTHYSQNSWGQYAPADVLRILDRAGVRRTFVSSTPDDGTVRLYEAAPDRVVPVLRPYRDAGDLGRWHQDSSVVAYLEGRLARSIYRGIGEFHLSGSEASSPVVRQVAALARRHGLFLHCHCDADAAEILVGLERDLRVLWAHAGMSAGPDVVGPLLDRYQTLTVELALRTDVAPGGSLDPAWRALFLRHPDRFMLGTDTWVASRWDELPAVHEWMRTWLGQLPPDVASRLASGNAERLAGSR